MFGLEKHVTVFDFIGFNGPLIMCGLAVLLLHQRIVVLLGYFFFLVVGLFLSKILKQFLKQPRPTRPLAYFTNESHLYSNEENYGMPSTHATLAAFSLAYFYLFIRKEDAPLFIISAIIYALTLYQRWKYRRHTILQIFAGTILGLTVGTIGYLLAKKI
jgi:membrane-associated phospholipid phosphatase